MSSTALRVPHTPEEYLALERKAEFKSEYMDGQIYAMSGGSPWHSAIGANLTIALGLQLRDGSCQVFTSDLKIAAIDSSLFTYPDLSVVCGEPRLHPAEPDAVTNPVLIAEVLSPSTELYDRSRKFFHYQQIESLQDYLLVAQDEARIEHYHRQAEGEWVLKTAIGLEAGVFLPFMDATIRLSDVYRRIVFSAPEAAD